MYYPRCEEFSNPLCSSTFLCMFIFCCFPIFFSRSDLVLEQTPNIFAIQHNDEEEKNIQKQENFPKRFPK